VSPISGWLRQGRGRRAKSTFDIRHPLCSNGTKGLKENLMSILMAIALVLVILWVLGFIVFHVAGALIHLLIIIALIVFVIGLFNRAKP
jgi:hypothetical protein